MTFDQYVRDLANRLGLASWKILIVDENPAGIEGDDAAELTLYHARVVKLWVNPNTLSDLTKLRETVIHELIHVTLAEANYVFEHDMAETGWIPNNVFTAYDVMFVREQELAVDQLARAISPLFPLLESSVTFRNCEHAQLEDTRGASLRGCRLRTNDPFVTPSECYHCPFWLPPHNAV